MRTSSLVAVGLAGATIAWFASGYIIGGREEEDETAAETGGPTLVKVHRSKARTIPQYIFAQGEAQPFRTADATAQADGTIDAIFVREGDEVRSGGIIARVRPDARSNRRESAQARVRVLEADLEGLRELAREGFTAASRVRELEAQLEEARAVLAGAREEIGDTTVVAAIPVQICLRASRRASLASRKTWMRRRISSCLHSLRRYS